ncbi:leucine-rich repeat-containing protein 27-like isoform X2 [Liolophura sinensis]|uniref:leucine-rich repeat-containing protein 27-like isoform X2 n=1 Tax=Liolophura sinensis TaxID=3198878 RepID=UPI003158A046
MTELDNSSSSEASVEASVARVSSLSMDDDKPTFAKTRIQEELVLGLIRQAEALGSTTIELCHKGLKTLPNDLLQLKNLEYLYLEGNELTSLPENFFDMLPNLQWLDVRRNKLTSLSNVFSEKIPKLRNLLLEGNNLTTLPPELGLIKSLNGLNISNNPLSFPPVEVIEQGTQHILQYLREVLRVKSKTAEVEAVAFADSPDQHTDVQDPDEEDWENYADLMKQRSTLSAHSQTSSSSEQSGFTGPTHQPVELHMPTSYSEIRAHHLEKLKKTGADGRKIVQKKSATSKKVEKFPAPPSEAFVTFKMAQERKLAKEKELKMRQEAILQRRRDEESLKNWRDESKKRQQQKHFESVRNGGIDYEEPAKQAPFGIDEDKLKMMSKEEKIKEDVRATHEKLRRRPLTPGARLKLEEEKATRIRELERRIKAHTLSMVDRRRKPKGTPQEEMILAQKELEVVRGLQKKLLKKYQDLKNWSSGLNW